tara:strand:+ start:1129 stop:1455 length:327 start_codon:yes stop_codon:yes gene_type:complete
METYDRKESERQETEAIKHAQIEADSITSQQMWQEKQKVNLDEQERTRQEYLSRRRELQDSTGFLNTLVAGFKDIITGYKLLLSNPRNHLKTCREAREEELTRTEHRR